MLSFVIPAYNEEKYLAPTLASIHAAARAVGEPYEIVVANDNSNDGTVQVAEAGGARVVTVHKRQIAGTRNEGAKAARGEWLVFVDADTQVTQAVLRGVVDAAIGGVTAAACFAFLELNNSFKYACGTYPAVDGNGTAFIEWIVFCHSRIECPFQPKDRACLASE